MKSAHSRTSFINSCVQVPVHPSTNLPVSEFDRFHNTNKVKKKKSSSKKATVSFHDQIEIEDDHDEETDDLNRQDIEKLINDDEQFFKQLHQLRKENERNLIKLKRLYEEEQRSSILSNNANSKIIDEIEGDSVITRNYMNSIRKATSSDQDFEPTNSSDEDELDRQLKVSAPESHVNILPNSREDFRGRESSYDVISEMWENFSVDDYAPYKKQKKKKVWSPAVTIPEPFAMTIRDEKQKYKKSKRIEKIEEEKLIKKLQEDAELQKKITPVPVPPSTFLPLYDELIKHKEMKHEHMKSMYIEMLKSSERPFSFTKREEAKKEFTKMLKSKPKFKKTQFKANPFPEKLFESSLADKRAEEEEYRKIKIKLRSQEMMMSSSLPANMKLYRPSKRNSKDNSMKTNTFSPAIHPYVPKFEVLQQKFENELEERKQGVAPTICEPFKLRTAEIPSRWNRFKQTQRASREVNTPNRNSRYENTLKQRPTTADNTNSMNRSTRSTRNNSLSKSQSFYSPPYRQTESARLRENFVRSSKDFSTIDSSPVHKKKSKEKNELQSIVSKKSRVNDVSLNRETKFEEKIKNFKKMDAMRKKEYKSYLDEMNARVKERPLLFEQVSRANAIMKAQQKYESILENAGVDREIVDSIIRDSMDYTRTIPSDQESEPESDGGSYSPPPIEVDEEESDNDGESNNYQSEAGGSDIDNESDDNRNNVDDQSDVGGSYIQSEIDSDEA